MNYQIYQAAKAVLSNPNQENLEELGKSIQEFEAEYQNPRRTKIIAIAREEYQEDGTLEIDDCALTSETEENGSYVQAWCWVDFEDSELDKNI